MQTFLILAVLMLAGAAYLVGEVVTLPGRERNRAVRQATTYGSSRVATTSLERLRFRERVLLPATASLAGLAMRLNPRTTVESISARLLAAGMGRKMTPTTFLAMKAAGGLGGAVFGFLPTPVDCHSECARSCSVRSAAARIAFIARRRSISPMRAPISRIASTSLLRPLVRQ